MRHKIKGVMKVMMMHAVTICMLRWWDVVTWGDIVKCCDDDDDMILCFYEMIMINVEAMTRVEDVTCIKGNTCNDGDTCSDDVTRCYANTCGLDIKRVLMIMWWWYMQSRWYGNRWTEDVICIGDDTCHRDDK